MVPTSPSYPPPFLLTVCSVFATIMCLPAVPQILHEFNSNDHLYSVILVSIWEIGEGIGPFIIAPLSEVHGRLPVYHVANTLFLVFAVASALSPNLSMLVAFRFLNGLSVASLSLGPAIVGDMFKKEERGSAMAVLYLGPLIGPVTAPIIGGFLAQAKGWRWTFWLIAISVGAVQTPSLILMRESYKNKILRAKLLNLRRDKGLRDDKSVIFKRAIVRPIRFLMFSPVVMCLSLYSALIYGYLYIILTTITTVFESNYGFQESTSGLVYLGIGEATNPVHPWSTGNGPNGDSGVGMVIGIILCGFTSDWYIKKKGPAATPEHRLPPMVLGGIVIPVGLFVYGWTARYKIQWMGPLTGTGLIGFGLFVTMIPTESYLVDAFTLHAASAVAATTILRNFLGAVIPLAGPPLYDRFGLGWGNSLLGFIALLFVPIPVILMRYGSMIRERWQVKG